MLARKLIVRVGGTVLVIVGLLSATPASAYCRKCEYIPFNGMRCVDVNSGGYTGCSDTDTCGTYGSSCGGASDCGDHCIQDPQ